jgi:uncharacterized membrane protein
VLRSDALLALLALLPMLPVALRQFGLTAHLPDPPLAGACADRVTTSDATHPFGIADSLLWIPGALVDLLAALYPERIAASRMLRAGVLAEQMSFSLFAVWLASQMRTRLHAWCAYCLVAGVAKCIMLSRSLRRAAVR